MAKFIYYQVLANTLILKHISVFFLIDILLMAIKSSTFAWLFGACTNLNTSQHVRSVYCNLRNEWAFILERFLN